MAAYDHALFYNSNNGDRVYDADSFEYLLKKFFTTGVFAGDCAVSPVSGMKIKMGAGYCNIGGKVRFFAEDTEFTLTTAHATYNRIDTVVIERNDSDREITAKVVTGTPGANPSATAPIRSGAIYQIVVAEIAVAAGAVGVTAIDITDKRIDSSVCGLVASTVGQPDFEDLYTQFTAAFDEWFDEMKDQLSEDAAGNLQNEIDDLDDAVVKHSAQSLTDAQKAQARLNIGSNPVFRWSMNYPSAMGAGDYVSVPVTYTETGYDCYAIYCTALMQTDLFTQLVMQSPSPTPNEVVVYLKNIGSSNINPSLTVLWLCIPKNQ